MQQGYTIIIQKQIRNILEHKDMLLQSNTAFHKLMKEVISMLWELYCKGL